MRLYFKHVSFVLTGLCVLVSGAEALSVSPIVRVSALGGEFFTTSAQATGGNYDAVLAPVIGVTPSLYLIPIYYGSYKQVSSIYDFLGESTLIEKQLDHQAALRTIWMINSTWRIKPRL